MDVHRLNDACGMHLLLHGDCDCAPSRSVFIHSSAWTPNNHILSLIKNPFSLFSLLEKKSVNIYYLPTFHSSLSVEEFPHIRKNQKFPSLKKLTPSSSKMGIRNAGPILLAFAIQLYTVIAVDPPGASIVGCSAVGCPTGPDNSTSANCVVAGRRSNLIGLANFQTSIVGDDDNGTLTWSETVGSSNNDTNSTTSRFSFERSFYLGAPKDFNLIANAASSKFGACAVFFTNISAEARFPGENIGTSFGTCKDAITADCANALVEQAKLAVGNNTSSNSSSSCENLKEQISKNLPPSCSRFATGNGAWNGVEVKGMYFHAIN